MFNSQDLRKNLDKGNGDGMSTLIIIRGPASSGKSSISKHFMKLINNNRLNKEYTNPFFLFPYEDLLLFHMMDSNFLVNGKESHRGFQIERNNKGDIVDFKGSKWAFKLYETYQDTLTNYIKGNFNIICEGNFINIENIKVILEKLNKNYKVVIFSLNVGLDLLEAREKNRGDRDEGFAKLQFNSYQETLKNSSYQHIINVNKDSSLESISNDMMEAYKKNNHLYGEEILKLI